MTAFFDLRNKSCKFKSSVDSSLIASDLDLTLEGFKIYRCNVTSDLSRKVEIKIKNKFYWVDLEDLIIV